LLLVAQRQRLVEVKAKKQMILFRAFHHCPQVTDKMKY
jgi:hypothetical protein